MDDSLKKLTHNVTHLMGGTIIGQIVSLAVLPCLAIFYEPADLGIAQVFTSIIGILSIICCGRLDQALLIVPEADTTKVFSAACVLLFVVVAATTVISVIVLFLHSFGHGDSIFLILGPALVFIGITQLVNAVALRRRAFKDIARTKIEQSCLNAVGVIGFGAIGLGAFGLVGAQFCQQVGGVFRLRKRVMPEVTLRAVWSMRSFTASVLRANKHLLFWATGAGLVNSLAWSIPVFAIAHYYGAAEAGLFALATRVLTPINNLITGTLNQITIGEGGRFIQDRNYQGLKKQIRFFLKITFLLAGVVAMAGFIFGGIGGHYLAPKWAGAAIIFIPLCMLIAMQLAVSPANCLSILYQKQDQQFKYDVVRVIFVALVFIAGGVFGLRLTVVLWLYVTTMAIMYLFYYRYFMSLLPKGSS